MLCVAVAAITNHMATDTEKMQLQTVQLHNLWSCPARIIVAMYLLYDEMQASILIGLFLLVITMPINVRIVGWG